MPSVHNGIGTWYWGKSNIHRRTSFCNHCNKPGVLESYDTTLYFVVFFVPVIPLGAKRIFEQCPSCKRHHALSAAEWARNKQKAIADVNERLNADPGNREALLKAIDTSVQFQDESLLDEVAAAIVEAPVLDGPQLVRLADAFGYFSRWTEAERACRAALDHEETPEAQRKLAQRKLAYILLKQGRPDEAEPLLQPILKTSLKENLGMIDLLIQGYQSQGMHSQALAVMDRSEQALPELAKDKTYKVRRKLSERHEPTGKKVASALLNESRTVGTSEGNWTARLPRMIFPVLVVAAVCIYLSVALWMGSNRKVYLANGTAKAYTVTVNGAEQKLGPGQVIPIHIQEGDLTLKVLEPRFPPEPMVCRISTPFFSRPFSHKTFVLNPDQSAILLWEETEYVAAGKPQPQDRTEIHMAKLVHEFSNVNYEFAQFPQTLTIKENERTKKTRIELISGLNGRARLQLATTKLDEAGQLAYARRRLALDPNDIWTLGWFVTRLPTAEAISFLRTGLADRPINVEWHRHYQSLMEEGQPEHDLAPEYRKLVQEDQRSPSALYLLARVSDPREAVKFLDEAERAPVPSAYAMASLGFRNLAAGRFREAVSHMSKATPHFPPDSQEYLISLSVLWAAGAYDKLLVNLQQLEQVPGFLWFAKGFRVKVLAARGDDQAVRQTIEQARTQNQNYPQWGEFSKFLEAARLCAVHDAPGYLKALSPAERGSMFWPLLLDGKLLAADEVVKKDLHGRDVTQRGLLYLFAVKQHDKALVESEWQQLIACLDRGGRDLRYLGKVLKGSEPVDAAALRELPIDPDQKRVLLTVVAQRFPDADKTIAALARRLDYQRDEVSLCLRSLK